jgi:hypothetical protein
MLVGLTYEESFAPLGTCHGKAALVKEERAQRFARTHCVLASLFLSHSPLVDSSAQVVLSASPYRDGHSKGMPLTTVQGPRWRL